MKPHFTALQLTAAVSVTALFGAAAFGQPLNSQPPAAAHPPVRINPATGLPVASGAPPAIDPATGLPVPAHAIASAPDSGAALTALTEARELIDKGRYEEALQRYLWYHAQTREAGTGAALVSALSDWIELGRRYPKAKQALIGIRDHNTHEFVEGRGYFELFTELANINEALGEQDRTYALYKGILQADPPLAGECYFVMETALVEHGEYALCARYLGDPQVRLDSARRLFGMEQGLAQQQVERHHETARQIEALHRTNGWPQPPLPPTDASDFMRKSSVDRFVRNVGQLIEILVGAGRKPEAGKICDQALATLDDPRLKSAISDAEQRIRAVQASPRPEPAPVAVHPLFVESSSLFTTNLTAPSASVEHWSPKLEPGTKPDLQAILSAAKEHNANNRYEESLQHHLWYHNHALEYEPEAQRGVRLSFALSDWAALGRKYPKARQALLEIRDRDLHEFAQGRGSAALFKDIAAINEQWGYYSTTCRLFRYLKDQQPELARRCYPVAEDALVKKGEYALCLAYIGDGQARFKEHCEHWEKLAKWEQHMGQVMQQGQQRADEAMAQNGQKRPAGVPRYGPPAAADNLFVGNTRQLIEILVGGGHKADAENICTQALALLDDPRLKSAVSDAEKKVTR